MGNYFHIVHARKTCVTEKPNIGNWITKVCIITWFSFWEKKYYLKLVLFCEEQRYVFNDCFVDNLTRKHEKDFTTYFPTEMRKLSSNIDLLWTLLATRSVFQPFWKWRPLVQVSYKPQLHKMLLCRSTVRKEPQTILFVLFGDMPDLFLGSPTQVIFSHFLAIRLCLIISLVAPQPKSWILGFHVT